MNNSVEILTMGNVRKDFDRLRITGAERYRGKEYGVWEVLDSSFKTLCDEPDDIEGAWDNCGWRHCIGSNMDGVNNELIVNGHPLKCWYDSDDKPEYDNLLDYLLEEIGCSQPKNICALATDLAKFNGLKLSELFIKYQGDCIYPVCETDFIIE